MRERFQGSINITADPGEDTTALLKAVQTAEGLDDLEVVLTQAADTGTDLAVSVRSDDPMTAMQNLRRILDDVLVV